VEFAKADLVILNTCAITEKAVREARQQIFQLKKSNPKSKVLATGCAATLWKKNEQAFPEVDYIFDNVDKEFLVALIEKNIFQKKPTTVSKKTEETKASFGKFLDTGRLMVRVQNGCDYFCTFCIVPYLRGRATSDSEDKTLEYIKEVSKQETVNEVIISGINLGLYGEKKDGNLTHLVKRILEETKVLRVSFGSLYMENITEEFLSLWTIPEYKNRLTTFFHIPLQSGSNKILALMRRRYTREQFATKIHLLKKYIPETLIATDIIVGFLEETEADFAETYDFVKELPLTRAHIFRYSKREFTAGSFMAKRMMEPTVLEKKQRAKKLDDLFKKKLKDYIAEIRGIPHLALILRKNGEKEYLAVLQNGLETKIVSVKQLAPFMQNVKIEHWPLSSVVEMDP